MITRRFPDLSSNGFNFAKSFMGTPRHFAFGKHFARLYETLARWRTEPVCEANRNKSAAVCHSERNSRNLQLFVNRPYFGDNLGWLRSTKSSPMPGSISSI